MRAAGSRENSKLCTAGTNGSGEGKHLLLPYASGSEPRLAVPRVTLRGRCRSDYRNLSRVSSDTSAPTSHISLRHPAHCALKYYRQLASHCDCEVNTQRLLPKCGDRMLLYSYTTGNKCLMTICTLANGKAPVLHGLLGDLNEQPLYTILRGYR
jgi:hypothetical protein